MKTLEYITLALVLYLSYSFLSNNFYSPLEAKKLIDANQAVLVDVREADEVNQGMLKNAHWLSLSKLKANPEEELKKLQEKYPDKTFLLYCRSGNRSSQAKSIFEKNHLKSENIGGFSSLSKSFEVANK